MPFPPRRRVAAGALLAALLTAGALPAHADDPAVIDVPAGLACDFALRVTITANEERVDRTFTDRDGNVVRTLSAGRGSTLTFENLSTGTELALQSNGSVMRTTLHPDGSSTVVSTGHNVIILFPTDDPAGPSTTLHVGQVTYDVSPADNVFTLTSVSGQTRDICAELE